MGTRNHKGSEYGGGGGGKRSGSIWIDLNENTNIKNCIEDFRKELGKTDR